MDSINKIVYDPLASGISSGDNPMVCGPGEYFSGTECKSSTVLHIARASTPGIIIPMKSRFQKNYEWTLETWVYVDSSAGNQIASIISLEGDWTKLAVRRSGTTLVGEFSYDSMGDEMTIPSFSLDTWHHVALVARLESQYYYGTLFLDCDGSTAKAVEIVLKSNVRSYDHLLLGMERADFSYLGKVSLKEVRVWNVALDISTLTHNMRKQIRNPEAEIRLAYYYPLDSTNPENLYDKAFEGDLQDLKLWNTAHTYKSGTSDPATVVSAKISTTMALGLPGLTICDQNSFYNSRQLVCEKDVEEAPIGLEQSLAPFTIPLTNYYFQMEWTVEFWLLINQISGVGTSIFSQQCYPTQTGTLSLKKVGTSSNLSFSLTGTGFNLIFPQQKHQWTHYAFANDVSTGRIHAYKNGVKMSSNIPCIYAKIPSCALTVGEFSTWNILYGKFKEIRMWNGTRTETELIRSMHRALFPQYDSALVLYLPMSESTGQSVLEKIQNIEIALSVTKFSRELWTAQGDLKICRTPYIYSAEDNACICK